MIARRLVHLSVVCIAAAFVSGLGGSEVLAKGFIVKFKSDARAAATTALEASSSEGAMESVEAVSGGGIERIEAADESDLARVLEGREVEYVEPDGVVYGDVVPNDPMFASDQWSLNNSASSSSLGGSDIDVERAWDIMTGSRDVFIFFFDSGMDTAIPDLQSNLYKTGDDILGYDFLRQDAVPEPESNHGTHVASIAGAQGNDNRGMAGVAWNATLVPLKFLDKEDKGEISNAIRGYEFMAKWMKKLLQENPKRRFIASNSWGGTSYSRALRDAMAQVQELGALIVTSAGNHGGNVDNTDYYPCKYTLPALMCVAASDINDGLTSFSGYGLKTVHLMAPGDRITGYIGSQVLTGGEVAGVMGKKSGTSQAVPHVSGVAALVWAVNPEYSAEQVMQIILMSSDYMPSVNDKVLSGGRLNAFAAVSLAKSSSPKDFKFSDDYFQNRRRASSGGCAISARAAAADGTGAISLLFFVLTLLGVLCMKSNM